MSEVFLNPKQDLVDCRNTITTLQQWKEKNWAIGMTYAGTHQPDGFFVFFEQRGLAFDSYLASPDLSTGTPAAYDKNIKELKQYAAGVYNSEVKTVDETIATIRDWQKKNWAIGLTFSNCQPDGFAKFLSLRGLPTSYYIVGGGCTYGSPSAYDNMVNALENYKKSLWNPA